MAFIERIVGNTDGTGIGNVGDSLKVTTTPVAGTTQDVNLTKVGGTAFALGQQLAVSSLPVVLTAAQISTLTPQTNALTDTQLRATAVPVSLTSTTITGTVAATQSGTWNIGTVTSISNALPSGTNVIGHVINDTGSTTAVTGNVTIVQPTGTNLHAVIDSGSTTAVTQATAANLNATVVGTGTFAAQVTGSVTANAGTNLNTSLLALESGGNLAGIKTQADKLTFTATRLLTDGSGVTQPVSGSVNQTLSIDGTTVALKTDTRQISTNTTVTPTSTLCFISSIALVVTIGGTTSTLTIKDKGGTVLTLINAFATTTVLTTPTIVSFPIPVKMVGGYDIVTVGAVAATTSVFVSYFQ